MICARCKVRTETYFVISFGDVIIKGVPKITQSASYDFRLPIGYVAMAYFLCGTYCKAEHFTNCYMLGVR